MMNLSKKSLGFIAALLFVVALLPRLYAIDAQIVQADERHWENRAHQFIAHIKDGNYSSATTHFSQPGLVPGVVMGVAQVLAGRINSWRGSSLGEPAYLDRFGASRIANAVVSSLLPPLIFVGGYYFFGFFASLLAACVLALDLQFLSVSRMAHVDAILSLVVTAAFLSYLYAERVSSTKWKILSGCCWGLAIATKPTSAIVVFSLLIIKAVYALGLFRSAGSRASWLQWGDVFAVLSGHALFCLIYTRFWRTNSPYVWRLHIESDLANALYHYGTQLSDQRWFYALTAFVFLTSIHVLLRQYADARRGWAFHSLMLLAICSALAFLLALFPPVFENLTRYWTWALGLSGKAHVAYGRTWEPPPYGYWGLLFRHVPTLVVLGLFCSVIWIVRSRRESGEAASFAFACFVHVCMWCLVLGVSSKQSIRYLAPALPSAFLLAAWGLIATVTFFGRRLKQSTNGASFVTVALVVSIQILSLVSYYPHYQLYYNALSGGLVAASARGENMPDTGQYEALRFLHEQAKSAGRVASVLVHGDTSVLEKAYSRMRGKETPQLRFIAFKDHNDGDFVYVKPAFLPMVSPVLADVADPVLVVRQHGVATTHVFGIRYFTFEEPLSIDVTNSPRRTGAHELLDPEERKAGSVLSGRTDKHQKGFLLNGKYARVQAGDYEVRISVRATTGYAFDPAIDSERPALKLEVSRVCENVLRRKELVVGEWRTFTFQCSFPRDARVQFRLYWWANTSLQVRSLELQTTSLK